MRIDISKVLWRTRGFKWDYVFVLRPVQPRIQNCYDFYVDAFSGATPSIDPINVGGVLRTTNGEDIYFIATTFIDPTFKDVESRPIAHYLIWFPTIDAGLTDVELPTDWGFQFVTTVGVAWKSAFSSDGVSDGDLLDPARSLINSVRLSDADCASIRFDRRVAEKKNRINDPPDRKLTFLAVATFSALILAVVIYWLTHR